MQTLPEHRDEARGLSTWASPSRDLWVANDDRGYIGMVERIDGAYTATDGRGHRVGTFGSLDEAQSAIGRMDASSDRFAGMMFLA